MNFKDMFLIGKTGIGVALTLLFIYVVFSQLAVINATNNVLDQGDVEQYRDAWLIGDVFVPIISIALGIVSMLLSYLVPSHPIFLAFLVFLLIGAAFIGTMTANMALAVMTSGALSCYAANFPMTLAVFQNFPLILVVIVALDTITMLSKWSQG